MKTWWIHKDKGHRYYRIEVHHSYGFHLCQENGSLSSIKVYDSKEGAIKDGWKEVLIEDTAIKN